MKSAASPTAAAVRPTRRDRDRRILPLGLALSALLHVIAIVLLRFIPAGAPEDMSRLLPRTQAERPAGLEVVPIRPVPDLLVVGEPPPPADTPPSTRVRPATEPPPPDGQSEPDSEQAFSTALEVLRPRMLDPRLYGGRADDLLRPDERAALRVYARMRQWNDSIAMEAERARRATDWTFTDSQGRRWGFSPGKIHLGNLEIPLPVAFAPPPGQRDLIRERTLEWEEIQAQAERGRIAEEFNERVRAIRERIDAERAEE